MANEELTRQARLLAQRDAELVALRQQYERAQTWWSTFHTLASSIDARSDLRSTCDGWCGLLLDVLDFQAAAVLRLHDGALAVEAWPAHLGAAPEPIVDPALAAALRERGGGVTRASDDGPLATLAATLRLERFLWSVLEPRRDTTLIALAGFDARSARYQPPFTDADIEQFRWVTRHFETVLRGVLLLQDAGQHERVQQMLATVERQRGELEHRLATITAQADTIRRLSTPVLELGDGVLVLPLIGAIDPERGVDIAESVLTRLAGSRGRCVILDVTGVDRLDRAAGEALLRVSRAASLLGARCVLTGVRPVVATTLVELEIGLDELQAFHDVGAGLRHCKVELGD